ncbi:MAG: glycosyltransferase [Gemmatimonadetes bacterium]|nr:glycosyltransferase [Gemmatimonadota bacterium]NIR77466.1 glycosyltransferase [Gemmatimonadota bacterium]NIT85990.1 glycosyltransferase [Gemmatimonadota bacterium]NIU29810.1 glycosyltransferase [Gemmatimonadota bacterium]NIU34832.1 glycosyltransferase [Gemmatimonadota bacterium]
MVLTEAQKREMSGALEIAPEEKFEVIPLGLELERFAAVDREAARREARAELGLDEDHVVVGIVGRMVPVKNHELLFDAVPRLVTLLEEGVRELRILVVGSGEREHELLEYARTLEIEDRVQWLGWRRDLERLYPAMDVLALTSHDEGTPVAVIEAMAARTPVVARDVGGVGEVLEDGRWGALVEWPDPAELAERIARAVMDPPAPERLEAASRSARKRFAVERMVEDVKALYRRELG